MDYIINSTEIKFFCTTVNDRNNDWVLKKAVVANLKKFMLKQVIPFEYCKKGENELG